MKKLLGLILLFTVAVAHSATGSILIPVQSAKLTGTYVTTAPGGASAAVGAAIDAGDGNWRVLFDDTVDEAVVYGFRMPQDYASGAVIKLQYSMTSGSADQVEWEVAVMAVTDGQAVDIGTASFDTVNVAVVTVPGTAGYLDEASITLTNDDSVAAGDFVYIYISTDSDDGTNDDATGDRELVQLTLEYTTS